MPKPPALLQFTVDRVLNCTATAPGTADIAAFSDHRSAATYVTVLLAVLPAQPPDQRGIAQSAQFTDDVHREAGCDHGEYGPVCCVRHCFYLPVFSSLLRSCA